MKSNSLMWILSLAAVLLVPSVGFSQVREVPPRGGGSSPSAGGRAGSLPSVRNLPSRSGSRVTTKSSGERGAVSGMRSSGGRTGFTTKMGDPNRPVAMPRIAPATSPKWELGVFQWKSPLGIGVDHVAIGTPAHRMQLERGDYILDVNGTPVGHYEGAYYDLTEVISYHANFPRDPADYGWVNLTIWNSRTQRVDRPDGFWVQLQRR